MKYFLCLLTIVFFTACSSSNIEIEKKTLPETNLLESLKIWKKYKNEYKNSYSYTSDFVSYVGFGNETKIQVQIFINAQSCNAIEIRK